MRSLKKLKRLNQIYSRSIFDRLFHYMMAGTLAISGGLLIGEVRHEYYRKLELGLEPKAPYLLIGIGLCMIAFGFFWLHRAGIRYEFQKGIVKKKSSTGRIIWEENLLEATRIKETSNRLAEYLIISFGSRKRKLELFSSINAELEAELDDDAISGKID